MALNSIFGTDSADKLRGTKQEDSILALTGDDTVTNISVGDNVFLDGGRDSLLVEDIYTSGSLFGGEGNDTLHFSPSSRLSFATVHAGSGNDRINISIAPNRSSIVGGLGHDSLFIASEIRATTIIGGDYDESDESPNNMRIANDIINSHVAGGGGSDTIKILGSALKQSSIFGDSGNDSLRVEGALSNSTLYGDQGMDSIEIGPVMNSRIYGGNPDVSYFDKDDLLTFSSEVVNSFITGNGGNDTMIFDDLVKESTLVGGARSDLMSIAGTLINSYVAGGSGSDTITLTSGQPNLINSSVFGGSPEGMDIAGKDSIQLSFAAEVISSTILGAADKDRINLAAGQQIVNSMISAKHGNDTLSIGGRLVSSSVFGGQGHDRITYSFLKADADDTCIESGLYMGIGNDKLILTHDIAGSEIYLDGVKPTYEDGNDAMTLAGSLSGSIIYGQGGDDKIYISGGVHTSTIIGGAGEDVIKVLGDTINTGLYAGGDDGDIIQVNGILSDATLIGGGSNDVIDFYQNSQTSSSLTYVFGQDDGNDTLFFNKKDTFQEMSGITLAFEGALNTSSDFINIKTVSRIDPGRERITKGWSRFYADTATITYDDNTLYLVNISEKSMKGITLTSIPDGSFVNFG